MKKVAVCYKWVLSDADIRVNEKTHVLDMEKCKPQINEYDRNGLNCGVTIKKATGCELVGITAGAATAASTKDALSRGPDQLYYVDDAALAEIDKTASSKVLAAIVKKIGEVDVVICSEGSSDDYAQQTGPRLAALLGWPSVSYVSSLAVSGDTFTLERKLEDSIEVVTVSGPVVISVSPEVGDAPIPGVKDVLGAKKKPANALSLGDIGLSADVLKPAATRLSLLAPTTDRKKQLLNPDGVSLDTAAANLVKELSTAGIL
ncbi:MAG: electron transfer flavoprotein subunit beta/FixA family protein [Deltaproteobacteria bacterium]|jgi:electron transfer flavoprotein beta subunit|nr:electron transfer flavoprotein subunit beta/FixA family protein [Deltaproteobacteria bacterium]